MRESAVRSKRLAGTQDSFLKVGPADSPSRKEFKNSLAQLISFVVLQLNRTSTSPLGWLKLEAEG